MPATFHHGVLTTEVNEGVRVLDTVSTNVIGLVATGDNADSATFPQDKAVFVTNIAEALGYAGTKGTLAPTLEMIGKQTNSYAVIVRAATKRDKKNGDDSQDAAVIGADSAGTKTGMQALLTAKNRFGLQPRILGAPGLETEHVTNAMITIAKAVGGIAYMHAVGAVKEAVVAYRDKFAARELMLLWPNAVGYSQTSGGEGAVAVGACALGMRSMIDQRYGWEKTLSNVAINGLVDIEKDISFDLMNATSDADYLNARQITTLIQQNGFRLWGNETCSDDSLFRFESAARAAQIVRDTIGYGMMWAIDKPISAGLIRDIIDTINAKLQEMVTQGRLLGACVWSNNKLNTKTSIKAGTLYIDYDYTPVPPLQTLGLQQRITDTYIADLLSGAAA